MAVCPNDVSLHLWWCIKLLSECWPHINICGMCSSPVVGIMLLRYSIIQVRTFRVPFYYLLKLLSIYYLLLSTDCAALLRSSLLVRSHILGEICSWHLPSLSHSWGVPTSHQPVRSHWLFSRIGLAGSLLGFKVSGDLDLVLNQAQTVTTFTSVWNWIPSCALVCIILHRLVCPFYELEAFVCIIYSTKKHPPSPQELPIFSL